MDLLIPPTLYDMVLVVSGKAGHFVVDFLNAPTIITLITLALISVAYGIYLVGGVNNKQLLKKMGD